MGGIVGRGGRARARIAIGGLTAAAMLPLLVLEATPAGANPVPVPVGYELAVITPYASGSGNDIDPEGVAVGRMTTPGISAGFRHDGATLTTLDLPGFESSAHGIADDWIVGDAWEVDDPATTQPFRWDGASGVEVGDLPVGATAIHATAVSNNGTAVGWMEISGARRPMIWYQGADPAPMFEALVGEATDISPDGTIVGWTRDEGGSTVPFWSQETELYRFEIDELDGYANARPTAIAGTFVVGNYDELMTGPFGDLTVGRGFRLDTETGSIDTLSFFGSVRVNDVNASGVAVGDAFPPTPLVWDIDGDPEILGLLTVNLVKMTRPTTAEAINDAGQIVGSAVADGETRGVRFDPIDAIPDVAVDHSAQPNPAEVGDQVELDVAVSAGSPGHRAYEVTTETLISGFVEGQHGSVTVPTACVEEQLAFGYRVRCAWHSLDPGNGAGGAIFVTFAQAGTYESHTSVTHAGPDANPDDDSASVTVVVNEKPAPPPPPPPLSPIEAILRQIAGPVLQDIRSTVLALARLLLGRPWQTIGFWL